MFLPCRWAMVLALAGAAPCGAVPGSGRPLTLTTGTVYTVSTVGELTAALAAANAAGEPATLLLAAGDVGAHEYRPGWAARPAPVLATFADGIDPTHETHLSPTGDDVSGDGSPAAPYRTLSHAAQFATPGTALVLASGIYPGGTFLYDLAGTASAPIWIRGADPANRPVLSGGSEGLHLVRARYVVVENLEITGAINNGINCDDGGEYANPDATRFLVFRHLDIHDIGGAGNQDGLKLSGLNDYHVLDCSFARCGGASSGSGIDQVGCHRGVIARCTFEQMSGNAIQCKGGSEAIDILHCRITDGGQRGVNIGGSTGFAFFRPPLSESEPNVEARDIRVLANRFEGSATPVAFVGCVDSLVANNTILSPGNWFFRILQETVSSATYDFLPCSDSAFVNNLVRFRRAEMSTTDINVGPNTDPDSFVLANNLWYATDNPAASTPDYPVPEANGIVGQDPQLDPANDGISLDSPAALEGWAIVPDLPDITGRVFLSPPSIGAREIDGDRDADQLDDYWELVHFGGTNVTDGLETQDADADGFPDRAEYIAGTDPNDPDSRLRWTAIEPDALAGIRLQWPGVEGRLYAIDRTADMMQSSVPLATNLSTSSALGAYVDPSGAPRGYYRLSVGLPKN